MKANLQGKFGPLPPDARAFVEAVGRALREARQERGEDIPQIAAELHIKPSFLTALENGDYELLPGRAYAYGFLRSYADHLGFDGGEVVRRVKQAIETVTEPETIAKQSHPARRRAGYALLAAALAALALLLLWQGSEYRTLEVAKSEPAPAGQVQTPAMSTPAPIAQTEVEKPATEAWRATALRPAPDALDGGAETARLTMSSSTPSGSTATSVPAVPAKLKASERVPPVTIRQRERTATRSPAEGIDATLPAAGTSAIAAEISARRDARTAAAPASLPELAAVATVDAAPALKGLRIVARDSGWVQIRSRDGSYVRTRMLQAGESYAVPERSDLLLWLGDAGAFELLVDGQRIGPLGEKGTVIRDLPLDPRALRAELASR